jgi:hypothetical protein
VYLLGVLIHFQIRGGKGWEALGSGVSEEEDPLPGAIEDLRSLHGGDLPEGRYRYVEAQGPHFRSGAFRVGRDGRLID